MLPALIRRFHEAAEANAPSVTCWGTGSPLREFLHVDDLGEASVFALEHWSPAPGELLRAWAFKWQGFDCDAGQRPWCNTKAASSRTL